jgi:hypothetical protein
MPLHTAEAYVERRAKLVWAGGKSSVCGSINFSLNQPQPPHAGVALLAHDDVVVHLNA